MAKDTLNNSVFNNMILIVSEPMSREGGASALRGPSLCCRMTLLSFSPFSLAELASWAGSKHRVKTGGVSAVFTFFPLSYVLHHRAVSPEDSRTLRPWMSITWRRQRRNFEGALLSLSTGRRHERESGRPES